ncbi:MAG: transcriptional repressor, partial [Candidatus Marinimicrobia bacterium]|nr:transcriptional repressor [Candidatus Neomarinimicrobiota bacterium]
MRYSYQREVIKNIVCSTKSHPNAEWVFCEAKKQIENISLGTVYRNLKILENTGKIKSIHDDNQVRYDGNTEHHHHLKCSECGVLIDAEINSNFNEDRIV